MMIGLTGGIASGKSTVADLFKLHGVDIIDADIIAHEVVKPETFAYQAIIDHFGKSILNGDHTIHRKKLAEIIFNQPLEKKWLENLLHPIIRKEIQFHAKKSLSSYCILVIPLLIESGSYDLVDRILVVDINEETQIKRLLQRENTTLEMARKILASQASRQQRLAKADDVIINNQSIEDLSKQVLALHQFYEKLVSQD